MVQILFSLIKEIKIGRPEHLLPSNLLRSIVSHICLTPPPQSSLTQIGRHICMTPEIQEPFYKS